MSSPNTVNKSANSLLSSSRRSVGVKHLLEPEQLADRGSPQGVRLDQTDNRSEELAKYRQRALNALDALIGLEAELLQTKKESAESRQRLEEVTAELAMFKAALGYEADVPLRAIRQDLTTWKKLLKKMAREMLRHSRNVVVSRGLSAGLRRSVKDPTSS